MLRATFLPALVVALGGVCVTLAACGDSQASTVAKLREDKLAGMSDDQLTLEYARAIRHFETIKATPNVHEKIIASQRRGVDDLAARLADRGIDPESIDVRATLEAAEQAAP